MVRDMIKRLFDIVVSALVFLLLSPLILIVGREISVNLGKPVFFKQLRPRLNGNVLEMIEYGGQVLNFAYFPF